MKPMPLAQKRKFVCDLRLFLLLAASLLSSPTSAELIARFATIRKW